MIIQYPWGDRLTVQSPWGVIRAQPRIGAGDRRGRGGQFATKDTPAGIPSVAEGAVKSWRKYNRDRVRLAKARKRGFESIHERKLLEANLDSSQRAWKHAQQVASNQGWHVNAQGKITGRPDEPKIKMAPPRDKVDIGAELNDTERGYVEDALGVIGEVHALPDDMDQMMVTVYGGRGRIPKLPWYGSKAGYLNEFPQGAEGAGLVQGNEAGSTSAILMSREADQFSFAHEFGHYFDARLKAERGAVVGKNMSEAEAGPVSGIMSAIKGSENYQALLRSKEWSEENAGIRVPDTGETIEEYEARVRFRYTQPGIQIDPNYNKYVLEERELFARAYSQYIAVKSGNSDMRASLDYIRSPEGAYGGRNQVVNQVSYAMEVEFWRNMPELPYQWEDSDFEPVAREFDKFFEKEGLAR